MQTLIWHEQYITRKGRYKHEISKNKNNETGSHFEGSKAGCICSGSVAVANAHNAGPAYCVGYCGSNGTVTRNANANLARTA